MQTASGLCNMPLVLEALHPDNPIVHGHLRSFLDRRIDSILSECTVYFVRPELRKFRRNNIERSVVVANDSLMCHRLDSRHTMRGARVSSAQTRFCASRTKLKRCVEMSVCNASALLLVNRLHRVADATRETNSLANKNRHLSGIGELVMELGIETRIL